MNNRQKASLARQIADLPDSDRKKIADAPASDLPTILEELGISLPASNWWMIAIKTLLYLAGLILAGMGTATAATLSGIPVNTLVNFIN